MFNREDFCCNCNRPLTQEQIVLCQDFCSNRCKDDYHETCRSVADQEFYDPPVEAVSYDSPWWRNP